MPFPLSVKVAGGCFLFGVLSTSASALSTDEYLCGGRPDLGVLATPSALELRMGEVKDQGQSNWCYAYTACDLVDEQLRMSGENSKASILDAVIQEKTLLAVHDHLPFSSNLIQRSRTGSSLDLWLALQKSREVARDHGELPADEFRSESRLDPRALYQPKLTCSESTTGWPASPALSELSRLKTSLTGATQEKAFRKSVQQTLSKKESRERIRLPAFTPHSLQTQSELIFLNQLKSQVTSGTPVIVGTCTEKLRGMPSSHCTPHAVIVVGFQYAHGQCTLRVRNSWGSSWMDHGYANLPVTDYLKSAKPGNHFQMEWLEKADSHEPAQVVVETASGLPEPGRMKKFQGTIYNQTAGYRFETGQALTSDGKVFQFEHQKIISRNVPK